MQPFRSALFQSSQFFSARLVATAPISSSGSATPASLGATAGALAIAFGAFGAAASGSGQAWNRLLLDSTQCNLFWKVLTQADLTQPVTMNGYAGTLVIYSGASALVQVRSGQSPVAGLIPSSLHAGLVAVTMKLNSGSAPDVVSPAAWAARAAAAWNAPSDSSGPNYALLEDRLSPPNGKYDGAPFVLASTSGSIPKLWLYEMRHA